MTKTTALALISLLGGGLAHAESTTETGVRQAILATNSWALEKLETHPDTYSKHGALEFWSSGGLLQEVPPGGGAVRSFDSYNIQPKHIRVVTLVEDEAAIAHYYLEGSEKPKGLPAVSNYLTRVTQAFVKEDGKWKVRSTHWSRIIGGSGTSQTALDE